MKYRFLQLLAVCLFCISAATAHAGCDKTLSGSQMSFSALQVEIDAVTDSNQDGKITLCINPYTYIFADTNDTHLAISHDNFALRSTKPGYPYYLLNTNNATNNALNNGIISVASQKFSIEDALMAFWGNSGFGVEAASGSSITSIRNSHFYILGKGQGIAVRNDAKVDEISGNSFSTQIQNITSKYDSAYGISAWKGDIGLVKDNVFYATEARSGFARFFGTSVGSIDGLESVAGSTIDISAYNDVPAAIGSIKNVTGQVRDIGSTGSKGLITVRQSCRVGLIENISVRQTAWGSTISVDDGEIGAVKDVDVIIENDRASGLTLYDISTVGSVSNFSAHGSGLGVTVYNGVIQNFENIALSTTSTTSFPLLLGDTGRIQLLNGATITSPNSRWILREENISTKIDLNLK